MHHDNDQQLSTTASGKPLPLAPCSSLLSLLLPCRPLLAPSTLFSGTNKTKNKSCPPPTELKRTSCSKQQQLHITHRSSLLSMLPGSHANDTFFISINNNYYNYICIYYTLVSDSIIYAARNLVDCCVLISYSIVSLISIRRFFHILYQYHQKSVWSCQREGKLMQLRH